MAKVMQSTHTARLSEARAESADIEGKLAEARGRVTALKARIAQVGTEIREGQIAVAMGDGPSTRVQELKAERQELTERLEEAEALEVGLQRLQGEPQARVQAAEADLAKAKEMFVMEQAERRIQEMKNAALELHQRQLDLIALARVGQEMGIRHLIASDILHLAFPPIETRRGWPSLGDRAALAEDLEPRMADLRKILQEL